MHYEFRPIAACNMCGCTSHKLLGLRLSRSQGFRPRHAEGVAVAVKRCRSCDLIFADPQPVPDNIDDHYGIPSEDYWTNEELSWTSAFFGREIAEAKRLLSFKDGMRALDIGSGPGTAMRSMSVAGFDTWGCEPGEQFRSRSIIAMDLDPDRIQLATVEEADYPANFFDFVTFGAVLEHLYDPRAAIDRAMAWLRPGGILHLEVPNADWLIARLVNLYYRLAGTTLVTHLSPMHQPFHLYEFTPRSFAAFEIAGQWIDPCTPIHVTGPLKPLAVRLMEATGTGMQLTMFLRRKDS